jgi:hypothetical protein
MANNIINITQDPDFTLFTFSGPISPTIGNEVRISKEDLVRTGFMDKYNELAQSSIYNIYSKFSAGTSGQQSLVFETSKGNFEIAIVGAGVVQGVGIITADSVVYNATVGSQNLTNVQEALDLLLYTPPSISAISGGWSGSYFEVGVNPVTSNATVNGIRQVKNLATVNLSLSGSTTNNSNVTTPIAGPSAAQTPSPANETPVTATLLAAGMSAVISTTLRGTYTLSASVFDTQTPTPNNGTSVTSSKTMQILHPTIWGSANPSTNPATGILSNVENDINNVFMPFSNVTLPANYATNGISSIFYRNIAPKPVSTTVIHANGLFTFFIFPKYYYADIATLLANFKIQDGSTNLNYPYDTDPAIVGGFQDSGAEWRIREISLTLNKAAGSGDPNPGTFTNVPCYLVVSKVSKPKLTIKYNF